MHELNRSYSLASIAVLVIAIFTVSIFVYFNNGVDADTSTKYRSSEQTVFLPLKKGDNIYKVNGQIITSESRLISINGSLISLSKATERGIVDSLVVTNSGKILGEEIEAIYPGEEINVIVKDISFNPQLYLQ